MSPSFYYHTAINNTIFLVLVEMFFFLLFFRGGGGGGGLSNINVVITKVNQLAKPSPNAVYRHIHNSTSGKHVREM